MNGAFKSRVRHKYEMGVLRKERTKANRRIVLALVFCLVAWSLACYLDHAHGAADALVLSYEISPLQGGNIARAKACLCYDCHEAGRI